MENSLLLRPIQFSLQSRDFNAKLSETDKKCFSEISQILSKYDKSERFGVSLISMPIILKEDEILVEYTNVAGRKQIIKPEKKTSDLNVIETNWVLTDGGPEAMLGCIRYCANNVHGNHDWFHQST